MHATMLCLAMTTLGVDVGWRPLPDGGMEYIIQIEPHMIDLLVKGEDILGDFPPNLMGVPSYRITVGTDELPREGGMEREAAPSPLLTPPRYGDPGFSPTFPQSRYPGLGPMPGSEAVPGDPPGPAEASLAPSSPGGTPRPLPTPTDTQPLPRSGEKPALFIDQEQETAGPSPREPERQEGTAESAEAQEPEKPSAPFTLALAGFLGSFGGMLYTGWLAWDYRRRYRSLLERMIDSGLRPSDEDETAESEAGQLPGLALGGEDEPGEF